MIMTDTDIGKLQHLMAMGVIDRNRAETFYRITRYLDVGDDLSLSVNEILWSDFRFRLLPGEAKKTVISEACNGNLIMSDSFLQSVIWDPMSIRFISVYDDLVTIQTPTGITYNSFNLPEKPVSKLIGIDSDGLIYLNTKNGLDVYNHKGDLVKRSLYEKMVCTVPLTGYPVITRCKIPGYQYAVKDNQNIIAIDPLSLPFDVKTGEIELDSDSLLFFALRALLMSAITSMWKYESAAKDYIILCKLLVNAVSENIALRTLLKESAKAAEDGFIFSAIHDSLNNCSVRVTDEKEFIINLCKAAKWIFEHGSTPADDYRIALHQFNKLESSQRDLLLAFDFESILLQDKRDLSARIVEHIDDIDD